jgi:hypothetical protein
VRAGRRVIVGAVAVGAVTLLVLGLVAALPHSGGRAVARAAPGMVRYEVAIQAVFDGRGDPVLGVNFEPDGSLATPSFSICSPAGGACVPARSAHGELQPGPEPAGTVFAASVTYKSHVYSSNVTWGGTIAALGSPSLAGASRVGARIVPIAGRWTGGWGHETDQLGVEACRTSDAVGCRMLGGGELGCPDHSSRPRIGNWYTGWYLFALDARMPADGVCAGTGYFTNPDLPLWKLGPTVSRSATPVRVVGPPAPRVAILHRARILGNHVLVARVECSVRCAVWVTAMGTRSGSSGRQSVIGSTAVGVYRRSTLMPGRLRVSVHVGGSPAIVGWSRLS